MSTKTMHSLVIFILWIRSSVKLALFRTFYVILKLIKKVKDDPMFKEALSLQKSKKFIMQGSLFFATFLFIYFIVDYLNMSYTEMIETYGLFLVVTNIIMNVLMSFLSALLMNLSTAMVVLKGREGKAQSFGFFSVLFGILTYGCTSCVIAFFASVGIAFSVVALPLAGLPYKLISLILITIGLIWIRRELNSASCKINLKS